MKYADAQSKGKEGKVVVSTEIYISKKMFQQQVTEDISDIAIYGL